MNEALPSKAKAKHEMVSTIAEGSHSRWRGAVKAAGTTFDQVKQVTCAARIGLLILQVTDTVALV